MVTATADAQFLIDNPEEASIEDLVNAGVLNEDGTVPEEASPDVEDEKKVEVPKEKDADVGDTDGEKQPRDDEGKFISAKDGKNTIPYHILENARNQAQEATAQNIDLAERLVEQEELNKILASQVGSNKQIDEGLVDETLKAGDIDVEHYTEEFGDEIGGLAKNLKILASQNASIVAQMEEVRNANSKLLADRTSGIESTIQEAIDEIPDLVEWQSSDPEKFAKAKEFDDILMADPKFLEMSRVDRFNKVADMVNSLYGSSKGSDDGNANDVVALAKSSADHKGITSLSHVDATAEDKTDLDKIDDMSVHDLSAKFGKMNAKQNEEWIRNNIGG